MVTVDEVPRVPSPRSESDATWVATRYADVQAVLSDERCEVAVAEPAPAWGSVAWLRASVSRFVNGAEHRRRRSIVVDELSRLDPARLRADAYLRTKQRLGAASGRIDAMAQFARTVPMATLAAALGIADTERAAQSAIAVAAAYFPGADGPTVRRADAATIRLVGLLSPADPAVVVARIALLVQGCDATAGLIGGALVALQDPAVTAPTDALLLEVLRHRPPLRASRRVIAAPTTIAGHDLAVGDTVRCDLDAAQRDPAVFEDPDRFDPDRSDPGRSDPGRSDPGRSDPDRATAASLTFGYGIRPCPAPPQALAIAAGVIDAIRDGCVVAGTFSETAAIEYEPSAASRIPVSLELVVRP